MRFSPASRLQAARICSLNKSRRRRAISKKPQGASPMPQTGASLSVRRRRATAPSQKTYLRDPAARCARVLPGFTLENKRAQGMPGARCTRGLVRKMHKEMRTRAYRFSGGVRHPLRDGFTAYAVLSPATNSSCHRRRRILRLLNPVGFELATADLAPATGVRTTRFCRTLKRRSSCTPANRSRGSTRPATSIARRRSRVHHIPSRVRDDARPPLLSERDSRS